MRTVSVVVLAACLVACSSPAEPVTRDDAGPPLDARATEDLGADAGAQVDAGEVDAGRDAGAVEIVDAGPRDSGPRDAGVVDAGWACSVIPQGGCPVGQSCRFSIVGGARPGHGPPACERTGSIAEGELGPGGTPCTSYDPATDSIRDNCRTDLFCGSGYGCRRYCDPDGEPCPPLCAGGTGCVQRCNTTDLITENPLGFGFCELAL